MSKATGTIPQEVPPLAGKISFNAQHSPMGAFMSFTCGHFGTGGGIGAEIGKPAGQNVLVGIKRGGRRSKATLRCLPFARGVAMPAVSSGPREEDYAVEQAGHAATPTPERIQSFAEADVTRHYGWATDTWNAPGITFRVYSPFGPIPEPGLEPDALPQALLPAVLATLTIDNRNGAETATGVFALDFPEPGVRVLDALGAEAGSSRLPRLGFAWRRSMGVLATLESESAEAVESAEEDGLFVFQRWSVLDGLEDPNPVHALGNCGGVGIEVPAGQVRTIVLSIGVYLEGVVTTGLEGRYYYTRFYGSLEHVLSAGLDRAEALQKRAAALDRKLLASGLSPDQQFLVAHATRSYYGSTQLLDVGGEPFWVVNEGEYCMMNTLDLSIDHAFWELEHNPWVVRNLLENFARHYSFTDQLPRPGEKSLVPGGISFCHDMGVNNNFSAKGTSSYELPNLTGCFSHMTQEQLCNWVLLAGCYVASTRDGAWARANAHLLRACLQSLHARRGAQPGDLMRLDSNRCEGGSEITTYDSLDESLGQARNNLYLGVKRWAAYGALRMIDEAATLGGDLARKAAGEMVAFARRLRRMAGEFGEVLPAVLEKDNPGFRSRILSACEALVYPWYWNTCGQSFDPEADEYRDVLEILCRHTRALLLDPDTPNLFPDGGIKLSSTSCNSWMSKIALFQHVCRALFNMDQDPAVRRIFTAADAAHVRWQIDGGGYWACSDQFVSGQARGSRYYPRIITTALWFADAAPVEKVPTSPHRPVFSH